jgi:hypothetical protein
MDRPTEGRSSLHKTKWCEFYWRSHGCYHGNNCSHAHFWHEYCGPSPRTHDVDGGHIGDVRRHDGPQEAAGSNHHMQLMNEISQCMSNVQRADAALRQRVVEAAQTINEAAGGQDPGGHNADHPVDEAADRLQEAADNASPADHPGHEAADDLHDPDEAQNQVQDDSCLFVPVLTGDDPSGHEADRPGDEAADRPQEAADSDSHAGHAGDSDRPTSLPLIRLPEADFNKFMDEEMMRVIGEDSGGHKADHPGDEAADDPHDPDGAQEQVQDDRSTEEVLRYIFGDHEAADDADEAADLLTRARARAEEELRAREPRKVVWQCSRGYWVKMDKLQSYFGGEHGLSIKYLGSKGRGVPASIVRSSRRDHRSPTWILLSV